MILQPESSRVFPYSLWWYVVFWRQIALCGLDQRQPCISSCYWLRALYYRRWCWSSEQCRCFYPPTASGSEMSSSWFSGHKSPLISYWIPHSFHKHDIIWAASGRGPGRNRSLLLVSFICYVYLSLMQDFHRHKANMMLRLVGPLSLCAFVKMFNSCCYCSQATFDKWHHKQKHWRTKICDQRGQRTTSWRGRSHSCHICN